MKHTSYTQAVVLAFLAFHLGAMGQDIIAVDRLGRTYTADQIKISDAPLMMGMGGGGCPSPCAAGIFLLDFRAGSGFDDPTDGPARQEVARQVFEDYSQLIVPADDPCNGANLAPFVRIVFYEPTGVVPAGAAGVGSSFYNYLTINNTANPYDDFTPVNLQEGVLDGEVWRTINGGTDSWRSINYAVRRGAAGLPQFLNHGLVSIDFNAAPFYTGVSLPVPAGMADLYSVIAHEATHMLGFHTFTTQAGLGFLNSRYYSRYDLLLGQGGTDWIIDPLLCSGWATNTDPAFDLEPGGCGTTVSGNYTTVPQPVHAPAPWSGSSLSHLDGNCGNLPYLMHHNNLNPFGMSRVPLQDEVNVLCDIDYHTSTQHGTSGSGWDDTYHGRTSCGKRLAGVDDLISDCTTSPFYTYKQGQALPITIDDFLENDEDEANTSIGIIGTPQSYACMEAILGGYNGMPLPATGGTSFNYRPDPGYVGWAIIRYRPVSVDGRLGNITYIFVEVWPPDVCGVEPCNILNGGSFEGLPLHSRTGAPHDSYQRTGASSNSPDLVALDSSLPPPNWLEMNNYTTTAGMCGIFAPLAPGVGLPPNERYMSMIASVPANPNNEGLIFELCRPLLDGVTYTLEYLARTGGNCQRDMRFYAFQNRPCNPLQGLTDFTLAGPCNGNAVPIQCVPLQSVATDPWQTQSTTFTFSGTSRNWLIAISAGPTNGAISVDDFAIHPIITADATIQPSCNGQSNGSITLDVHYYDGEYDILWLGGATTANLSNLAPGDYTVTITDNTLGCASFTQTYTVLDGACSDDWTLTKTVSTTNTYSGAPVLYSITLCNNTGAPETIPVTDSGLSNFVATSITPAWPGFPAQQGFLVPAGECLTIEVAGHFTAINDIDDPNVNCATITPADGPPLTACADPVNVRQNCPLAVSGTGDCTQGPVNMCMSVHSLITNIGVIEFDWVYPAFLTPPTQATLLGALVPPSGAIFSNATITAPITPPAPYDQYNGVVYNMVHLRLTFDQPFSTAGHPRMFCVPFELDAGNVPENMNTFITLVIGSNGVHRTDLYEPNGGPEIHPGVGFMTQAANVILTGCPGIQQLDASFTVDVPACGGAVSVHGNLTDPAAIHFWTWGDDRTTPINGAQDYTYDYFEPITMNTDWPVIPPIPAAAPGTYTITHTVIVNGVASISTQAVTTYECCAADLTIHDGDMASMIGTYFTGTVDIQGQFIVDENTEFDQAQVYMEAGAEIIVRPGVSLGVSYSTLESCQNRMWKAITAEHGSVVYIKESTVMDAENVLTCLDGSTAMLVRNEFRDNRNTLFVPEIVWMQWNDVSVYLNRNVFTSTGSLAQPYPGQTTSVGHVGYAAVEVYNTYADLTGGDNVIDRMSNGIIGHRSDVVVSDFGFKNVQPDAAYNYIGNGSGIFAQGDHSYNKLVQEGYGMGSAPSFENCYKGIHARYMTLWSTDNNMQNVGMPYTVERSNNRNVDILNNRLHALFNGIDLRMNDGAEHIRVQYNDITFGDVDNPWVLMPSFGIIVSEGNMGSPDSKILNNTIHFVPKYTSFLGIGLLSAAKWLVAENTLDMTNNAFNQYGIGMDGSNYNEVSCNAITGASSTDFPNDRQAAIVNFMGLSPLISCNTVDRTANGVLFNGAAYGTELRGNQFNRHRWGLHLAADALIEGQDHRGNLWYNEPAQGGWGALHENEENAQQFRFKYNPATISGGSTQPPSWAPDEWFQYHDGPNYDCLNDHGGAYCEQFRGVNIKGLHDLDSKIAADSLENDPYTEETKAILKSGLYKKLDEDAALRDSVPDMAAFYNALQSSTIASFKAIDDDQKLLYDMDSTVVAQLQANRLQIEGYMDLVKGQLALLDDSTLTDAQRNAIIAGISGYRQNIQTLTAWNTTAMETARTSKALTTEGIKTANANIGTTKLMEANEKQVNEIYLTVIAKEVDTFTVDQTATLFFIANQCPMVGGNAVFKARSMYRLINDTIAFDDQQLCLPHGIIVKSLKPMDAASTVGVVPNPARDEATLVLERPLDETGTFVVYNTVGKEVMHWAVPPEELRIPFSTRNLAPGMYHYRVMTPKGMEGQGKWSIVR